MKRSFGASPQDNQDAPKPGLTSDQAIVADQDTQIISSVHADPTIVADQDTQIISSVHADQAIVADQDTQIISSVHADPHKIEQRSPKSVRHLINAVAMRLQEPLPEGMFTRGLQSVKSNVGLGWVPFLALCNALGLLIISGAFYVYIYQNNYPLVELFFFTGLLLAFVPNLLRLLSRAPSRLERIYLISILSIYLYAIQFIAFPHFFASYDETLHWRTADDILRTGHLFTENSMLPVSPYFPGLELITNAVSTTTGLSPFYAGNIVIIASRLLMLLALYLFYEHIMASSRMASIASLIYMTNQHFLFFDAAFSYETLALPLATFMIYILTRYRDAGKNYRWVTITAWIVLVAVTITHHMTDYFFDGVLLLWAGISFSRRSTRKDSLYLIVFALVAVCLSLVYAFFLPGNPVQSYLSDYLGNIFVQLKNIFTGSIEVRSLFNGNVGNTPIWDKLLLIAEIGLITFGLPFGLFSVQRRHSRNALAVTLSIVSLAYPLIQALRLTSFGLEVTNRSMAFLFLPIAYVLTVFITHFWPGRKLNKKTIAFIASMIIVVLIGGTIAGTGPNLIVAPGPYQVVADARSIELEGINTAIWSRTYLGSNNRLATDRINSMLMSTFGEQRVVTGLDDNIDVSPIFYSEQFNTTAIAVLRQGQIHYLIVDLRLSTGLPLEGTYFGVDRPIHAISRSALMKFNSISQINRLVDSGDIAIYDTSAFISSPVN